MGRLEEIKKERLKKLEELRRRGIEVYPYGFERNALSADVINKYARLKPDEKGEEVLKVAGRVVGKRQIGSIAFCHINDGAGKLQIVFEKGFSKNALDFFTNYIDVGDFIGVEGVAYRTRAGEISILAKNLQLLTKAILPLPEKWHGLKDVEERYRKRYLDLMLNPEVRRVFEMRTKVINAIRECLNARGFIEVETPLLQPVYGGATARPFITELYELHMPMYLSISPELYLKRLLVGGFEKVYTICKNFRNEGIDRSHNPEFTMLEAYWAYVDYDAMMDLFEEIFEHAAKALGLKQRLKYGEFEIDFSRPWRKITVYDAIKKYLGIDVKKLSQDELEEKARELGVMEKVERRVNVKEAKKANKLKGFIVEELLDLVTPKFIQPTHLIDHPIESTPLCKAKRGDAELVERCEPFMAGMEIGNIYSELNDPLLQKKLFEEQQRFLKTEAHPIDEDFVEALSYGMPPAGGLGLGVDRVVMLLTNQASIRDVILFPFMKPEPKPKPPKSEPKPRK